VSSENYKKNKPNLPKLSRILHPHLCIVAHGCTRTGLRTKPERIRRANETPQQTEEDKENTPEDEPQSPNPLAHRSKLNLNTLNHRHNVHVYKNLLQTNHEEDEENCMTQQASTENCYFRIERQLANVLSGDFNQ